MSSNASKTARHSPWPYAIAAGLGVVVAVNVWLARVAAADPPVVEADKPYEAGEAYQREIEASRASAALGYRAEVEAGQGRVRLTLVDRDGRPVSGLKGESRLVRPERRDRDQVLTLVEGTPGVYEAPANLELGGVWRVSSTLADARGRWVDERRLWVRP